MRSGEQIRVVELDLVGEDVAVDVRRDGEVALADVLADSRPGDTGKVQERDTPVPKVVGRERGDAGGAARSVERSAEAVGAEPLEDRPSGGAVFGAGRARARPRRRPAAPAPTGRGGSCSPPARRASASEARRHLPT